jgi:hypothetical protein
VQEDCHGFSLLHKAAEIAFWLAETDRLCEGREGLRLFMEPLVSQGLQETDFYDMTPSLASGSSLAHGIQALESSHWLIFGEEDTSLSYLLSFTGKGSERLLSYIQFLGPTCGLLQFSTGQPEPNLIDGGKQGIDVDTPRLVHAHAKSFKLLESLSCGLQISAREVETYQYRIPKVQMSER